MARYLLADSLFRYGLVLDEQRALAASVLPFPHIVTDPRPVIAVVFLLEAPLFEETLVGAPSR